MLGGDVLWVPVNFADSYAENKAAAPLEARSVGRESLDSDSLADGLAEDLAMLEVHFADLLRLGSALKMHSMPPAPEIEDQLQQHGLHHRPRRAADLAARWPRRPNRP